MTSSACPVCAAPAWHALPNVGHGAAACDSCGGFWLDPSVGAWLKPIAPASAAQPGPVRGHCPACSQPLAWQPFRGPTTAWLGLCAAHGIWFERTALPAIGDAGLRTRIARAAIEHDARLPPDHKARLLGAVDATARFIDDGLLVISMVRRTGNPRLVSIGVGAVANDGLYVRAPDGSTEVVIPPSSRFTMVKLVGILLAVTLVPISIWVFWSQDLLAALLIVTLLALTFLAGTGMFLVLALIESRRRMVVDCRTRAFELFKNGRHMLEVPFALARATRVQLYANPGYGDNFDVLVTLGFAELWIHQDGSRQAAHALANRLAELIGAPKDPEEERKGG